MNNFFDKGAHFPLGYGPYRAGQEPGGDEPSAAEIIEDLSIIKQDTNLIRTYGACEAPGEIPSLAKQQGIFLYQGVYLSDQSSTNNKEMNCYNTLVNGNQNIYKSIIGNETLLRGDLTDAELIAYINQAKTMNNIPVSTGEPWDVWCDLNASKPRCPGRSLLSESVDYIVTHVYPYWEGTSIENGAAHVMAIAIALRATYPNKEIVIGETGWPTCGNTIGNAVPGVDNQRQFIEDLWRWSNLYNVQVIYFDAFDESWKVDDEGTVGGCWGIYDENRTPKHTTLDWSIPAPEPNPVTTTVQIEHPKGSITTTTNSSCAIPVFGRAYHAAPGWHVKVEVFTNQWYIQDKWYAAGLAPIVDNMWSMPEIILGGQGIYNNHSVRATLVDENGVPQASDEVTGLVRSNVCTP